MNYHDVMFGMVVMAAILGPLSWGELLVLWIVVWMLSDDEEDGSG